MRNFYVDNISDNLSLEKIKELMARLNNPQNKINFIHVAGSDGKTSICNMLSNIYENAKYKVGLFTSPHIINFNERIKINNKFLSNSELLKSKFKIFLKTKEKKINDKKKLYISYFEMATAMAFDLFYKNKCDLVILEVGLGGRLDSTNIINAPLCSVITNVSLEHTQILGDNLNKIASEKVGIIKNNCTTISYPYQKFETIKVIEKKCLQENSELIIPNLSKLKVLESDLSGSKFIYKDREYFIKMLGYNQIYNAITSIEVVNALNKKIFVDNNFIFSGLKKTKIEARIEVLKKDPLIILDGAHDYEEILMLVKFLRKLDNNIILIFGMLKDKDINNCLNTVFSRIKKKIISIFTVTVNHPRAISAKEIKNIIQENYFYNVHESNDLNKTIQECYKKAKKENYIITIFGSFYLAKDIKKIINNINY